MARKRGGENSLAENARAIHAAATEAIKIEIARQELSYYRIARDTGISPSALSRFRQPGGTLRSESLFVLLNYLGVDLVAQNHQEAAGQPIRLFRAQGRDQ